VWARHTVLDADFDAEFLMYYLERSVDRSKLRGSETVIKFRFTDMSEQKDWWLLVEREIAQVCLKDPGKDVNVYFDGTVRMMHDVWMGDKTNQDAIKSGNLVVEGDSYLTRNTQVWLKPSISETFQRAPLPA
jgi:alkyl sulfatase BDS1-like metallo-beta-lactamase superfamily hydrolase